MTNNPFQKATKTRARLRMAMIGASGNGKTYSALSVASAFGKTAVIDTERGSASKYAGLFDFDVLELMEYHPQKYIDAIRAAAGAGYDVLVIDSLSHAWSGTGGVLEIVDKAAARSQGNKFAGWRDGTPLHNALVDAILNAPMHVIVTMRSKTEYVLDKDERTGKTQPRKVGLAPVQRDGMEYEFDLVGDMDTDNNFVVTKSRIPALSNAVIAKPSRELGETLLQWLNDGADAPPQPATPLQRNSEPAPNTVRGAGIQPTPKFKDPTSEELERIAQGIEEVLEADLVDTPPNLYTCTALVVNKTRTATQFILKAGQTNIPMSDYPALDTLHINGAPLPALQAATYPLEPAWRVQADKVNGAWEVYSVTAPEAEAI